MTKQEDISARLQEKAPELLQKLRHYIGTLEDQDYAPYELRDPLHPYHVEWTDAKALLAYIEGDE